MWLERVSKGKTEVDQVRMVTDTRPCWVLPHGRGFVFIRSKTGSYYGFQGRSIKLYALVLEELLYFFHGEDTEGK